MGMAVQDQIRAMTIDYLSQPRSTHERENFSSLTLNGSRNRRIVNDDYTLGSAQLGHSTFEFHSLVNGGLNKLLELGFAESSQHAASEAAYKAFGTGETNAIPLVRCAIENFDA